MNQQAEDDRSAAAPPPSILVVDDDRGIRKVLEAFFNKQGFKVAALENVDDALAAMAADPAQLVITDMIMPVRTGLDLLQAVHLQWPHVPVIMITGMPEVEGAVECMKEGAFDYITKPFDFSRIMSVVERALAQATRPPALGPGHSQTVDGQIRAIGRYQIESVLGEGNVGVVFMARPNGTPDGKRVAIKMLKQSFVTPEEQEIVVKRFVAEAEITSTVRHPNIIDIIEYDMQPDDSAPYMVMEYFEGHAMTHYIEYPELLDFREKTVLLRQVADALAAVHQHGILHRDIKPHNILVNKQLKVRVMDFGVAKNPGSHLTLDNELIGSPAYISPEGFGSADLDQRSDIFSLGVVAYELYLGVRPFQGESLAHFAHLIQHERPIEPRKIRPDFPLALQRIVSRMLKKNPDDRYPNASEVVADFDAFLGGNGRPNSLLQSLTSRLSFDWK